MKKSLYRELMKNHEGYKFRKYRCTGTRCDFQTEAIEGVEIFCNTPGCRGETVQSHLISNKNYTYRVMKYMLYEQGVSKPRFDTRKYSVSATTRRQIEKLMSLDSPKNQSTK
jgi:hypothetical protein